MREMEDFDLLTTYEKTMILRRLRSDVRKFESCYAESGSVKSAVDKFCKATSTKRAEVVIASLVNSNLDDGRICRRSIDWAKRVDGAWSPEVMRKMPVSSMLHPAHLDEVACELARRML